MLLIINDWYFKSAFHNEITGKLSDFAGLFAFPFFLSLIFVNKRKAVHYLVGIVFLYWNSEFSQAFIDYVNVLGVPINRTVDITDNMALISIFISYKCLDYSVKPRLIPIFQKVLIVVSCIAFIATTLPPHENRKFIGIDKEYQFEFSKRELVSSLNMVQLKEVYKLNKLSGEIDFNKETNVFHYQGRTDTLALIIDYNKISEMDTLEFKTSFAEVLISGDESSSKLKLISVYKFVPTFSEKDFREKAIKQFEKGIIKKIRKYR